MTILNLQKFIVGYIRDFAIREQYQQDKEALFASLDLSDYERGLIENTNMGWLDKTALHMYRERLESRGSQFLEFSTVMDQCGLFGEFFEAYVRAYPSGMLMRKEETEYFYEFGQRYIKEKNLPDVLLELLQYSYYSTKLSFDPMEDPSNSEFDWNKPIYLKKPYVLLQVENDILQLTEENSVQSLQDLEAVPKNRSQFFIQKSYATPLSVNILEVDDPALFDLFESNATGQQILAAAANEQQKAEWNEVIQDLFQNEIIGVQS